MDASVNPYINFNKSGASNVQVGSEIEYSQSKGHGTDRGGDVNKTYNTSSLKESLHEPKSNSS